MRTLRQPSDREIEVAQLCADGLTMPKVAERMGISVNTVKTHANNLFRAVGASTMAQAVATGLREGWLR